MPAESAAEDADHQHKEKDVPEDQEGGERADAAHELSNTTFDSKLFGAAFLREQRGLVLGVRARRRSTAQRQRFDRRRHQRQRVHDQSHRDNDVGNREYRHPLHYAIQKPPCCRAELI